jgi:hypothetical protein
LRRESVRVVLGALAALALGSETAHAAVIDFESLAGSTASSFTTFTENGFFVQFDPLSLATVNVHTGGTNCGGGCATDGTNAWYSFNNGELDLMRADGSAFTLNSLQLAQTFSGLNRALDVQVTGFNVGGASFVFTATEPAGGADVFHTFDLPSTFTNLHRVSIRGAGDYPLSEFSVDNIATDGSVVPTGGGVPEPSTWALMILGLAAAGALVRRARAATAAA